MDLKNPRLGKLAEVLRERIRRAIMNAPGDRWKKTGRLLASLKAEEERDGSAGVTVSPDRLQRDDLAQMFADELLPDQLTAAEDEAIARAIDAAIHIEVKK